MANHQLIELRRDSRQTGLGIAVGDYTDHPTLCRHGLWVGLRYLFTETVVLSYEHEPEPLSVFWKLQHGAQYMTASSPSAGQVIGAPGISYRWPFEGLQHRIAFVSETGTETSFVTAQVVYMREGDFNLVEGPEMVVRISGEEITWPPDKLAEEEQCNHRFHDLLNRYVHWRTPLPGETVMWLDEIRGPAARRVTAVLKELESLGNEGEKKLVAALRDDLTGQVLRAQYRAGLRKRGMSRLTAED